MKGTFDKRRPRLTPRAADAAGLQASEGGISAKNHAPTMVGGRRRRAADAFVSLLKINDESYL